MQMLFFWLEMDRWESFTAVSRTPSPTLKLDCPLVEHSEPVAEPDAEPATELVAEPVAVPAAMPVA